MLYQLSYVSLISSYQTSQPCTVSMLILARQRSYWPTGLLCLSRRWDSNPRPQLPLAHVPDSATTTLFNLALMTGFEPAFSWLKVKRSTVKLHQHCLVVSCGNDPRGDSNPTQFMRLSLPYTHNNTYRGEWRDLNPYLSHSQCGALPVKLHSPL